MKLRLFLIVPLFWGWVAFAIPLIAAEPVRASNLSGIMVERGRSLVMIKVNGTQSRWLSEGEDYAGNKVIKIDAKGSVVEMNDSSGEAYSLRLDSETVLLGKIESNADSRSIRSKQYPAPSVEEIQRARAKKGIVLDVYPPLGKARSLEGLDLDWINSDQNPMRDRPLNPDSKKFVHWASMSESEKEEFLELYRQCGWQMTVTTSNKGVALQGVKVGRREGSSAATALPASRFLGSSK